MSAAPTPAPGDSVARVLQAMGKDRLLPPLEYFGLGHGPTEEPRRATVLTLAIALAIVWAGGLNAIAEIISMFFMVTYGAICTVSFSWTCKRLANTSTTRASLDRPTTLPFGM